MCRIFLLFLMSNEHLFTLALLEPKAVYVELVTDLIDRNTSPSQQAENIPNTWNSQGKVCAGLANVIIERNPSRCQ